MGYAWSTTWYVSNDGSIVNDGTEDSPFNLIQQGIDTSFEGDTIIVSSGDYLENINFNGKNISIIGEDKNNTIINGNNSTVVSFLAGEDHTSLLSGFTIINGSGYAGGIYCNSSSPSLNDLNIEFNFGFSGVESAGGIYLSESSARLANLNIYSNTGRGVLIKNSNILITNSNIHSNTTNGSGGGLFIDESIITANNLHIYNNILTNTGYSNGGGIYLTNNSNAEITESIIYDNLASTGGGVYFDNSNANFTNVTITNNIGENWGGGICFNESTSQLNMINCIMTRNTPENILLDQGGSVDIQYSNISGGWNGTGNIDENSLFCNPVINDYYLAENSPCVGTGYNGLNMGGFGIGCEALSLNPIIDEIENFEILEDTSPFVFVSASYYNFIDEYTLYLSSDNNAINFDEISEYGTGWRFRLLPELNWFGTTDITVVLSDDEGADTTEFTLTVLPINDPPSPVGLIEPTIEDTFYISLSDDEPIPFIWSRGMDIDSEVFYKLVITPNFLGGLYENIYPEIIDTFKNISTYSWAEEMTNLNQSIWEIEYNVYSMDGEFIISSETGAFVFVNSSLSISDNITPLTFNLYQNYPNPFNPTTEIKYDLPEDVFVSINIYDVMGRKIKSLSNANQTAGYHSLQWDATNNIGEGVSAGMYIYTIQAGEYRSTKKMVLLK